MFRRHGRGRGRAYARDLDRIEQCENSTVAGVEQRDHALDGREPMTLGIAREVRVDLHCEDRPFITLRWSESCGLYVKAAAVQVCAEYAEVYGFSGGV
jgi:hypothetical protein